MEGFDPGTTHHAFAKLYGVETQKAEKIFIGKPIRLKRQFDRRGIMLMKKRLTDIGVECSIEAVRASPTKTSAPAAPKPTPAAHDSCEQCHNPLNQDGMCSDCATPKETTPIDPKSTKPGFRLADTPIPVFIAIAVLAELAIHTLVIHLIYYANHEPTDTMIIALLRNEFIYLSIIWALLKVFRIGWAAAVIDLGFNIHGSLGFALASYSSTFIMLASLASMIVGFTALLIPSVLRRLAFRRLDQLLDRVGRPAQRAFPALVLVVFFFSIASSENEEFSILTSQQVMGGVSIVRSHIYPYLYEETNYRAWPVGNKLPIPDSMFIKSATFIDGNMIDLQYLDSAFLEGASMRLKFSDDGTLLQCFTDTIPGHLIAPNCVGCVCDASSSTVQ